MTGGDRKAHTQNGQTGSSLQKEDEMITVQASTTRARAPGTVLTGLSATQGFLGLEGEQPDQRTQRHLFGGGRCRYVQYDIRGLVAGRHSPRVTSPLVSTLVNASTEAVRSMYHDGDTESRPAASSNRQVANVASSTCWGRRVPAKAVGLAVMREVSTTIWDLSWPLAPG
ncbi:hypothetical protein CFAM422_000782 [Trichoderma lentiforme]|uniref:Uncharacterized protein n=1 Tax=Trichoderma lentiforme TaxID=1567552 RepID=A0A9P5CGW1_9HYPO|nr:hypothetical protein CFAM422_000782 [Trichoderma lentiforme]